MRRGPLSELSLGGGRGEAGSTRLLDDDVGAILVGGMLGGGILGGGISVLDGYDVIAPDDVGRSEALQKRFSAITTICNFFLS